VLLALALLEGARGVRQGLQQAAAASDYQAFADRVAAAIPQGSRVLALHQFWFGVYAQRYVYRSIVLTYYLSDPQTAPSIALPIDQVLDHIDPQYILIDRYIAPGLHLDRPAEALTDPQQRLFRLYMERHRAAPIAKFTDPSYGEVMIYRLLP
jgi:hypothetical protein